MLRRIVGFHQDDIEDWVAELDCLHGQHVRHQPPFWPRPWSVTTSGRDGRIGTDLECPSCDRAELPGGLVRARTAGPFEAAALPPGLRREHRVAPGTWAVVRVAAGEVHLAIATSSPIERHLAAGDEQAIPPDVPHRLSVSDDAVVAVDFLVRA